MKTSLRLEKICDGTIRMVCCISDSFFSGNTLAYDIERQTNFHILLIFTILNTKLLTRRGDSVLIALKATH